MFNIITFNKKYFLFLLAISFLVIISCSENIKEEKSKIPDKPKITESSVTGMYSGPGLYGFGATVNLYYGGSFVMEDPGLPEDGPAFGDWTLNDQHIDFYMEGRKVFSARVIDKGLIIGGKKWEKVR